MIMCLSFVLWFRQFQIIFVVKIFPLVALLTIPPNKLWLVDDVVGSSLC